MDAAVLHDSNDTCHGWHVNDSTEGNRSVSGTYRDVQFTMMTPILLILCVLHETVRGDSYGPCADFSCSHGEVCKVRQIPCLGEPCPEPVGQCMPIEKSGMCPLEEQKGPQEECVHRCDTDADCQDTWKCCGLCKRECIPIDKGQIKPGQCPPLAQCPETLPYCPSTPLCQGDDDCAGARKCCGKCPRLCIEPDRDDN